MDIYKDLLNRGSGRWRDRIYNQIHFSYVARIYSVGHKLEMQRLKDEGETTAIYAVRTTAGQERNGANLIEAKARSQNLPIKAILASENIKGYIFIEATEPHVVDEAIAGIKHIKSRVPGKLGIKDIEHYLVKKPVIEELDLGDIIEIIGGPFKGMRAKITRVDRIKKEVTLELLEAAFTLPITARVDYVKLIEKGVKEEK
jgi:transcriptional antiterminator NusG